MAKKKASSKVKAKSAVKARSAKATSRAKSAPKKKARANRILSQVDQRLMGMAVERYEKLFKKISQQSKKLNEDRKVALAIGERVLKKVNQVRGTITEAAIQRSPLDLKLIGITVKKSKQQKPTSENV